jgi:hypothetical protein
MAIAAPDLLKFVEGTGHMPRLMALPERAK